MKLFGVVGVAAAVLLVAGCGKDKKGLTQAQAARVTTRLDSLGRAQRAGQEARANPLMDTAGARGIDDAQLRMAQRLRSGGCQFDTKRGSAREFGLSVKGAHCPMELDFS